MATNAPTTGAPSDARLYCHDIARLLQSSLSRLEAVLFSTDYALERLDRHRPSEDAEQRDRGRLVSLIEVCSALVDEAQGFAETIETMSLLRKEGC